jgi:histidinol-phosphate aminotransferase
LNLKLVGENRRNWLKTIGLALGGATLSRIAAVDARAVESAPAGGRIARLSLNENPYGPAPSVVVAVRAELANLCRYTDAEFSGLITAIATKEAVSDEHIVLGEILEPLGTHLSLQGGPMGEFIYSDPGYTALIDAAAAVGGVGIPVPLDHRLRNDLPAITAKVNRHTRAVFLVNPHNPTGTVAGAEELKAFVRKISADTLVIVDEAYLEFADDYSARSLVDLVRAGENVIVFRTFAKVYGLAGLDIGYGLLPKGVAQELKKQGLNNPHLFNRFAVTAAAASLKEGDYVANVAGKVARERSIWFDQLRDLGLNFTGSQGNFVFFETGMPHAQFAAAMLKEGVDIGRAFQPYDHWARISIGLPSENARARAAVHELLRR